VINRKHGLASYDLTWGLAAAGLALAMMLAAHPLSAQQPRAGSAIAVGLSRESLEEIVVTGSRIPQPGQESISPLSAVSQEDLALRGSANVEEMLNEMPQLRADNTASSNNPGSGIATLDLRGLRS
jgi:outer membrane cobalamin receptor